MMFNNKQPSRFVFFSFLEWEIAWFSSSCYYLMLLMVYPTIYLELDLYVLSLCRYVEVVVMKIFCLFPYCLMSTVFMSVFFLSIEKLFGSSPSVKYAKNLKVCHS